MFGGWGRTLSSTYPTTMVSYNRSVWPHDNSLIAAGMAPMASASCEPRLTAIVDAGLRFPNARLPELFCGFPRDQRFARPAADYLTSCVPQAWSAAWCSSSSRRCSASCRSRGARARSIRCSRCERVDVKGCGRSAAGMRSACAARKGLRLRRSPAGAARRCATIVCGRARWELRCLYPQSAPRD